MVGEEEGMKKVILFWLSLFLVVGPAFCAHGETGSEPPHDYSVQQQEPPSTGAILGDFIFIRPFGVIATALGAVGTLITLPIAIPSQSTGVVAQQLIAKPFAFTFTRPLGTFPTDTDIWP